MKPSKLVCFATFQRICQHWHIALLGDVHVWPPPSCTHRVIVKQRMQVHGLYTNSCCGITQASVHFDSATRRVADAVKGLGSSALSQCTAICGQVLHI
ncbi:uncharacterized protein [Physcomitrium patens]|uniref:uncharacterized protein isoform X4 n=1 Tax=Physcomitrium patens TaxID=3218 RepID=UPI003CCDAD29